MADAEPLPETFSERHAAVEARLAAAPAAAKDVPVVTMADLGAR